MKRAAYRVSERERERKHTRSAEDEESGTGAVSGSTSAIVAFIGKCQILISEKTRATVSSKVSAL